MQISYDTFAAAAPLLSSITIKNSSEGGCAYLSAAGDAVTIPNQNTLLTFAVTVGVVDTLLHISLTYEGGVFNVLRTTQSVEMPVGVRSVVANYADVDTAFESIKTTLYALL